MQTKIWAVYKENVSDTVLTFAVVFIVPNEKKKMVLKSSSTSLHSLAVKHN